MAQPIIGYGIVLKNDTLTANDIIAIATSGFQKTTAEEPKEALLDYIKAYRNPEMQLQGINAIITDKLNSYPGTAKRAPMLIFNCVQTATKTIIYIPATVPPNDAFRRNMLTTAEIDRICRETFQDISEPHARKALMPRYVLMSDMTRKQRRKRNQNHA